MTLKRLMIILGILVVLAGAGIAWLWQYAYSPEGRARVIIAQLKEDKTSLRGWMLQHHLIRSSFPDTSKDDPLGVVFLVHDSYAAADEMVKLDRKVLPIVIEALQDDNGDVRLMAAKVCGKFRDPIAIQPLVNCMRNATSDQNSKRFPLPWSIDLVQAACVSSLVEIGPDAYGSLMEASKECGRFVRCAIPEELARKWGAAAVPHLIELVDDSDNSVRAIAARELGEFKDKRATDALIRHVGDGDAWVARQAAVSLAQNGRDEGFKYLLAMLKSSSAENRAYAASQFGTIHFTGSLGPLLALLKDSDVQVRISARGTLWKLYAHDPDAIPAIRKLLSDPDAHVRADAATALEELASKPSPASEPAKP